MNTPMLRSAPVPPNDNPLLEIAEFRIQIQNIAKGVEEIKRSVEHISALDKSLTKLAAHSEQTQRELKLLWTNNDELRKWSHAHEADAFREKADILAEIGKTDDKIDAVVNRGKGALWIGGILFSLSQLTITMAVSWVFSHVNDADSANRVIAYRVEQLEKKK